MKQFQINSHIRLEPIDISMAPVIFETIDTNREFLRKWLPFVDFTTQLSDTESFVKGTLRNSAIKKDEIFSIWYNEEFAGLIGFKDTDWVNLKTELGYWISEKMQGKGIVTLCVQELIKYSFVKLKLNRVQIKVAIGNEKSAAIPKKLGFRIEGIERQGEKHRHKFYDLEMYSLLRNDWNSYEKTQELFHIKH